MSRGQKKTALQLYSLAIIPMIFIFIFHYLPIGGIIIAFKDYKYNLGIFGSPWVGLENFTFFVKSNDFMRITWNTLSLNALMIVAGMAAAIVLAVLLFELRSKRATKVYETMYITPHFLSWVIVGYMAYALLNPQYGFFNTILQTLGIDPIDWYSEAKYWPFILTIASIWKSVGMDCVMYYAALMGIDDGIIEAAKIDGAGKLRIAWSIMIPSIVPVITMLFILKVGHIFRADFGLFYQLTRDLGTLYSTTDVIDTYVFRTMRVIGDMGVSSAIGLMQSVVGLITVLVTNGIVRKIDPERAMF